MQPRIAIVALTVAVAAFAGGMLTESARRTTVTEEPEAADLQRATLERENAELRHQLDDAQEELAALRRGSRVPETDTKPQQATPDPRPAADAGTLEQRILSSLGNGDGAAALAAIAELLAMGPEHHARVARLWTRLAHMDATQLDRLGLTRLDLSTALAAQPAFMRYALEEGALDPDLRTFAAATLAQTSADTRRTVLADLDYSKEKNRRVLSALLRAVRDIKGPEHVDRFLHLTGRTDLYNDTRSSIALMVAEVGGPKARQALDQLSTHPLWDRYRPVLESIWAPAATGLLVTNGRKPGPSRIGHNDLILEYAGRTIRTNRDLQIADRTTKVGQRVAVKLWRDGQEMVIHVTVTDTAPGHLHFSARPIVRR